VRAAIPAREDPREALLSGWAGGLAALPHGARIGTSAPRRRAQLLHLRPDCGCSTCVVTRQRVRLPRRRFALGALVMVAALTYLIVASFSSAVAAVVTPTQLLCSAGLRPMGR
jgi:Porphobilinogen deaminase, dipyromethane cofactor binding domain